MFKSFTKPLVSLNNCPKSTFSTNLMKTIENQLPEKWMPYYKLGRYDRQIGTQLLLLPCMWGLALGQPQFMPMVFAKYTGLMGVGALVSRSAGCIVNDYWDIEFDKKVERTKTRPLASGEISKKQAAYFFLPHVGIGLYVLKYFNLLSIKLTLGIIPIAAAYPLAKRFTNYPQAVLGSAFSWGVFVGYAAMAGAIDVYTCGSTYLAGICWTLIYDTVYAVQDKDDDVKIGVKSTALAWGDDVKDICQALNLAMFGLLTSTGVFAGLNFLYFPLLCATTGYLARMIHRLDIKDKKACQNFFVQNRKYGLLLTGAFIAGKLFDDEDIAKLKKRVKRAVLNHE